MIMVNNNIQEEEQPEIIKINPATKEHFELEIKRHCKIAPRDEEKLRELLKLKQRQNEQEATHMLKIHKVSYRD